MAKSLHRYQAFSVYFSFTSLNFPMADFGGKDFPPVTPKQI